MYLTPSTLARRMKELIRKIIINTILLPRDKGRVNPDRYSKFELAKAFRIFRITVRRRLREAFLITLGVFAAAFGLKSFILPNSFIDGGAMGISLLISEISEIPLSVLVLIVNAPFIFMGYKVIGRSFAIKTIVAITALAVVLALFEFPEITKDKLLVSLFGGFFLGAGIGLSVRGGAVIDGTEVLAIWISRKFKTTIGDVIMILNIVIFSVGAAVLSIETALYSMITYLAASRTLDFVIEGIEEYNGVTIISPHCERIREMIIQEMGRGVTVYKGKRGFGRHGDTIDVDILYTVITRLEINKLYTELEKLDPNAFIVMSAVKDTRGGMIKKRPLKH